MHNLTTMSELIIKYEKLNDLGKQELMDYLNYLVTKRSVKQTSAVKSADFLPLSINRQNNAELNNVSDDVTSNHEAHLSNWKTWTVPPW